MESQGSVLDRLKDFITIKELSECFGVSRPTIYNYAKAYEESKTDKLPGMVVTLFDTASKGTDEELKELMSTITSKDDPFGKGAAFDMNGSVSGRRDAKSADDVRTICLHDDEKYMVIFYKTPDTEETVLNLYVRDMGNYYCIGQYKPRPGRNFVIIDDLVDTIDYYYEIEQKCMDSVHKSGLSILRDDSSELR